MIAVDTNIVIRFLTRDDEQQYQQVYALFQHDQIYIANSVFLETEWVLRYAYEYQPPDIIRAFTMLLGLSNVEAEDPGRIRQGVTMASNRIRFCGCVTSCQQSAL